MHDLANVLAGEPEHRAEADELMSAAMRGRRSALGDRHPATLIAMNNLALLRSRRGLTDEALSLYEEALPGLRDVFGPGHSNTLATAQNLANLYAGAGRDDAAEALWLEAITSLRETGDIDGSLPSTMNNLAFMYMRQGRNADAEPLLVEAVAAQRERFGERDHRTFAMMNNLASLYGRQGRLNESATLFGELVALVRPTLGDEHPAVPATMVQWGEALLANDRASEAEDALRQALSLQAAIDAPGTWQQSHARVLLGASLAAQRRFEEAEPLLLDGFRELRDAANAPPQRVRRAIEHTIALYEGWQRPQEAEHWRRTLTSGQPSASMPAPRQ
jgi:tetratricopeptide (TPR) repeat protein